MLFGITTAGVIMDFLAGCAPTSTPEYSKDIIKYNLAPRFYTEGETGETRVQAAIDYLGKVRTALSDAKVKTNSSLNPRLADYKAADRNGIGDYAIFPISLTPGSTLVSVLDTFFDFDLNKKTKVKFNPGKDSPTANTETNKFAYDLTANAWRRAETIISFNNKIVERGSFLEENGQAYAYRSSLDLALSLLYEYTHALREDAILTILQNEGRLTSKLTSEEVIDLVRKKNVVLQKEYSRKFGLDENYRPNIAQGNAMQCLLLYSLEQLNGGYMPGARVLDPHPTTVRTLQQIDPAFQNLYRLFKSEVIPSGLKAANPIWLKAAGKP